MLFQHLRLTYKIIKSLCQFITKHKITTNHEKYKVGIKTIKTSSIKEVLFTFTETMHQKGKMQLRY